MFWVTEPGKLGVQMCCAGLSNVMANTHDDLTGHICPGPPPRLVSEVHVTVWGPAEETPRLCPCFQAAENQDIFEGATSEFASQSPCHLGHFRLGSHLRVSSAALSH